VTFILSPCAGLSPELPGMAGAELLLRQEWWLGACVASALGIGIALCGGLVARAAACKPGAATHAVRLAALLLGGVVLVAPHMAGAPHPAEGGDAEGGHSHRSLSLAAAEGVYPGVARRALDGDHSEGAAGAGPPLGMAAEFSVAVLLTTAVYWVLMGALCAVGFNLAMGYPAAAKGPTTRMPTEVGLGDMPPHVARPVMARLDVDTV
jgi:predicted cobalt transporter CbtA